MLALAKEQPHEGFLVGSFGAAGASGGLGSSNCQGPSPRRKLPPWPRPPLPLPSGTLFESSCVKALDRAARAAATATGASGHSRITRPLSGSRVRGRLAGGSQPMLVKVVSLSRACETETQVSCYFPLLFCRC